MWYFFYKNDFFGIFWDFLGFFRHFRQNYTTKNAQNSFFKIPKKKLCSQVVFSQMLRELWKFLESDNLTVIPNNDMRRSSFGYGNQILNVFEGFHTHILTLYQKGYYVCRATDYFLCKFKPAKYYNGDHYNKIIFPFRIKCEERIVVLPFGLATTFVTKTDRAFCWQVGQFNYYTVDKFGSDGWFNDKYHLDLEYNETRFLFDYKNQLDINHVLFTSKTYVDQTEIDTLKESASYPQAQAFRRVVCSILYDLPQHHLFQSYLRSRGFDVSISKEKYCGEGYEGTPFEHSAVLKWNVWNTAPKEDWLQSLWSKLH